MIAPKGSLSAADVASIPLVPIESVMAHAKVQDLYPSKGDTKDAFGEVAAESGEVNLRLDSKDGAKNRGLLAEVMAPWARAEANRGAGVQASIPRTYLKDRHGRKLQVAEASAERVAKRQGLLPVRHYGRASERITYRSDGTVIRERLR